MHEKQSVGAPRNIFQERTREKEYVCMCTCVSKRIDEREREREKDNERCSGSSVFKKKNSQKSNKLTILLSSVDALIKEK